MKRNGLVLIVLVVMGGCVDSGCPKGSAEVDGTCMTIEGVGAIDGGPSDGGEDRAPSDGRSDGGGAAQGDAGDARADGADAGDPASACAALECAEHAHCVEDGDGADCVCDEGYEGDGESCTQNPCAEDTSPCDAETTKCVVRDDEVVCECLEGWARCDDGARACSTDVSSDAQHCGACGDACAGDLACESGACEQRVKKLALGQMHSCALSADDDVLCWGDDEVAQLQRVDGRAPLFEAALSTIPKSRALSANVRTSCAITLDDQAVCWGDNTLKWAVDGPVEGIFELGSDLGSVEDVIVGTLSACVIGQGDVRCWGFPSAYDGEPGVVVSFADRRAFPFTGHIDQMSVGYQGCAVTADQRVACWSIAEAALSVIEASTGPIDDAISVSASAARYTACSVLGGGEVMCWGANRLGMLGSVGAPEDVSELAVLVTDEDATPLTDVVQVGVGSEHACARTANGEVWCWGKSGLLGNGGTGSSAQSFATPVREIDDAIEIAVGFAHSCARRRSGQVQCWGDNSDGQLGVAPASAGGIASSSVPVNVIGLP